MLHKGLLVVLWFPLTLTLLLLNLTLLTRSVQAQNTKISARAMGEQVTLASAGTPQVLSAQVIAGDARTLLLTEFMQSNHSPMTPYAQLMVDEADKNGFDFRLVPAIAMCESNLGKRMPKKDEYNFAGIAVYTGQNQGKAFDSWEHSITWISHYIKTKYYDKGITNLKEIGVIWAPPSAHTDFSWTTCVQGYIESIY